MTTIDDHHRENSQQNDGDPMTTFTAGDMSRQRNAEPTALHNVADIEGLRAAATQALRILERTGLAPITAALLRALLKPREGQASETRRTVGFGRGVPLREEARCPT
jgi:hypothetical protein